MNKLNWREEIAGIDPDFLLEGGIVELIPRRNSGLDHMFIRVMEPGSSVEQSLKLQDRVLESLGRNKGFITKKDAATFSRLKNFKDLKNGGVTIGVYADRECSKLLAQSSTSFDNKLNKICEGDLPTRYNPDGVNMSNILYLFENKGLLSDPKCRGCNIGEILSLLRVVAVGGLFPKDKTMVFADIAVENIPSLMSSLRNGFKALNYYVDDAHVHSYLVYRLLGKNPSFNDVVPLATKDTIGKNSSNKESTNKSSNYYRTSTGRNSTSNNRSFLERLRESVANTMNMILTEENEQFQDSVIFMEKNERNIENVRRYSVID